LKTFYDEILYARVSDAVDELTKSLEGFSLKQTVFGKFMSVDCSLSIKKVIRHPIAKNRPNKINARREWVANDAVFSVVFVVFVVRRLYLLDAESPALVSSMLILDCTDHVTLL
jgi:hypothetical protein